MVILHHPTGLSDAAEHKQMHALLTATAKYSRLVLTPNHDPGRDGVMAALADHNINAVSHLPRLAFLGVLKRAAVLAGNSSAGLIEASAVRPGGVPVVNVGDRQAGRERPGNVIDCQPTARAIRAAVRQAVSHPPRCYRNPFGRGDAGQSISKLLLSIDLQSIPIHKQNRY